MSRSPSSVSLVDALDSLLDTGVVAVGDVKIGIGEVDLFYVGVRLCLCTVSRLEQGQDRHFESATPADEADIRRLQAEIRQTEAQLPRLLDVADPQQTGQGLAKLVLTLLETLRKLMEKEVRRRIRGGSLSPVEIEKLGLSLKATRGKIRELQAVFGIPEGDLCLDLGPLGRLE